MKKVCSFFGHRLFVECGLDKKHLEEMIEEQIKSGHTDFMVGMHGEFDTMVLRSLLLLKDKYPHINIYKVYTSIKRLYKDSKDYCLNDKYTMISFPIEELHYKQQIIFTNKCMVDKSDLVICYLRDNELGGTKLIIDYAKKQNKRIINLYKKK